jgi:hypothetical protein
MLLPGRHSQRKTTIGSPNKKFAKQLKIKRNLLPQRGTVYPTLHGMVVAA